MSDIDVEEWMHASDEERAAFQASWDIHNGEGQSVITTVASLFKDECVYSVAEVDIDNSTSKWLIKCYVDSTDYETLKNRKNVRFLGFPIEFHNIDARPAQ